MHIQHENLDDTSMSILRDLDPNYGKANFGDQHVASRWKAATLTIGVASIAFFGWTAGQSLDAKIPDGTPTPSTIPAEIAVKPGIEARAESVTAQAEPKGALIDESKTATPSQASNLPLPDLLSSSISGTSHQKDGSKELQNAKITVAKPQKRPPQKSRKIDRPQSRTNKSLADRDVAIIRSLVK